MPTYELLIHSGNKNNGAHLISWSPSISQGLPTWNDLMTKIKSLNPTYKGSFMVRWFDGVDLCTLCETDDLRDAEQCLLKNSHSTIRLFITIMDPISYAASKYDQKFTTCQPTSISGQSLSPSTTPIHPAHQVVATSRLAPLSGKNINNCTTITNNSHSLIAWVPMPIVNGRELIQPIVYGKRQFFTESPKSLERAEPHETLLSLASQSKEELQDAENKLSFLKSMGYKTSDKHLRAMLRKYNGNLNAVIDELHAMNY